VGARLRVFDFDRTFVLQMLLFALLTVVLRPLLFSPVLRIFEERERRPRGFGEGGQRATEAGEPRDVLGLIGMARHEREAHPGRAPQRV
jgi:hypothetical protein